MGVGGIRDQRLSDIPTQECTPGLQAGPGGVRSPAKQPPGRPASPTRRKFSTVLGTTSENRVMAMRPAGSPLTSMSKNTRGLSRLSVAMAAYRPGQAEQALLPCCFVNYLRGFFKPKPARSVKLGTR